MPRLTDQILFLMCFGERFLPQVGEVLDNPGDFGKILPQGERAVRRALQRMIVRGEIKRIGKGITKGTELNRRHRGYELTKIGKDRVLGMWPQLAQELRIKNKELRGQGISWDGRWRIVVFDIPERYRGLRAILRRFLASVGFAGMQRSLWITPFDVADEVRAFLEASKLDQMSLVMEVEKLWRKEPKVLADQVWRLSDLKQKWEAFGLACGVAPGVTKSLKQQFAKLVFGDPWLPEELAGDLGRDKAIRLFGRLLTK